MEIKRKAYRQLLDWKGSTDTSKAMMIKGARRVGKSFLVEHFAENEYRSHIMIDFSSPRDNTIRIFEEYGNREMLNEFFNQLSVLYGVPLYERDSIIIFDEVQKYPKARELVKHLVADGRYDFLETGSLISIKKNTKDILIPSEEDEMFLYPLDFEEFLEAIGDNVTYSFLKNSWEQNKPLGNLLKTVNERLRLYMIVGGMPQAVIAYAETANYDAVEMAKRRIVKLYREDIAKYADNYVAEATAIFNSMPSQLAKHDKKLKYSALIPGKRSGNFSDAVFWIGDSMVGNLCYAMDEPALFDGFALNSDKLKCYMGDTGLLLTLSAGEGYLQDEMYKKFVQGHLSVNQGMMTENLVAQMLTANHHPLRFYETYAEDENGRIKKYEVDFLLRTGRKVTPVEVKSGNAAKHASIDFMAKKFKGRIDKGIILTKGDLRETEDYRYIPLAMVMFI